MYANILLPIDLVIEKVTIKQLTKAIRKHISGDKYKTTDIAPIDLRYSFYQICKIFGIA